MSPRIEVAAAAAGALLAAGVMVLLTLTLLEVRAMHDGLDRTGTRIDSLRSDLSGLASEAPGLMRAGRPLIESAGSSMEQLSRVTPRIEGSLRSFAASTAPVLTDLGSLAALPEMRDDVAGTREDTARLRLDMAAVRRHTGGLRSDIAGLGDDMRGIRADMAALPRRLDRVTRELSGLTPRLAPLADMRRALDATVVVLGEMLVHLRSLDRKLGGTWRSCAPGAASC